MIVGKVSELWRYPVKSMRGERRTQVEVVPGYGILGDRGWAVRDEEAGEIRGAKRIGKLVQFAARYLQEPEGASTPKIEITFPDGSQWVSDDDAVEAAISRALEREVTLWPRQPADDLDHYRRQKRIEDVDPSDMREQLGLLAEEELPDYSNNPEELLAELMEYVTPRGTYFDGYPLTLLTSSSMNTLAERADGSIIDSRRFRQNVIVDSGDLLEGFAEVDWCGREIRIGSVLCKVMAPISRCVMVTLPQADLPRDRSLMRTLVRETRMDLGVNLNVLAPGQMAEGDVVELL